MNNYLGEIAAIATSLCWSFTAIFFTIASKKVGSAKVNLIRLLLASIFLISLHFLLYGNLLPIHAESYRWWWLGLSGVIGLALGDAMLFEAFVIIGAGLSMLLMSLVPIISTILAWMFLHEILGFTEIFAIMLTVSGIIWVVLDKKNTDGHTQLTRYLSGILLGIGGALGQAFALITAKKGLYGDFPALSATVIRMITAAAILWIITIVRGSSISNFDFWKDKTAGWTTLFGAVFGPFLGVWLSLVAIKHAHIGIASTLMALPPIFLIPLTHWIFKEKITWYSVIGTVIATMGVAIIFLA